MPMKSSFSMPFLACISLLALAAECSVENQKASEYAVDDTHSPALEAFANPRLDDGAVDAFVNARRDGNVRVAVIDNGVDYTHPALRGRVELDLEGTRLRGVGYDAMGDDVFAHPNLINPTLFAFGAEAIVDGRIRGPVADPLALIESLDADFGAALASAVRADETLAASLFSKIGARSLSVFGAMRLLEILPFDAKEYSRTKEEGLLVTREARDSKELPDRDLREPFYRFVLDYPWAVGRDKGLPRFDRDEIGGERLWTLEHADRFAEVLRSTFDAFNARTGFRRALEVYSAYADARAEKNSNSPEERLERDLDALQQAAYDARTGGIEAGALHMRDFVRTLCTEGFDNASYAKLLDPALSGPEKEAIVLEEVARTFEIAAAVDEMIQGNKDVFGAAEVAASRKRSVSLGARREAARAFLEAKGLQRFTCQTLEPDFADDGVVKTFSMTYAHPYLSSKSAESTHGTHVGGIIASQSPDVRIVPVRVTTESVEATSSKLGSILSDFSAGFGSWLRLPAIRESLRGAFPAISKANPTDSGFDAALFALFEPQFEAAIESNPLEYVFIDDITRAIRYVGERKIKVANVSLGTTFASTPASLTGEAEDPAGRFEFLRFEYFKYAIARAMKDHAAQTLFVIAAGNDGSWVDGKARSALPCDLSSSFVGAAEAAHGRMPNNAIDNVLCVGSMGPNDELSSFTNLTITKVPFVLSYGEAVLSAIRQGDCEGSNQAFDARNRPTESYPWLTENTATRELVLRLGLVAAEEADDTDAIERALEGIATDIGLHFTRTRTLQRRNACEASTTFEGRLSGTSMASPAVAGFVARRVASALSGTGKSDSEVWDDPAFAPKALVEAIVADAPRFGNDVLIADVRKIIDVLPWKPAALEPGASPHRLAEGNARPTFLFVASRK